MKQRSVSVILPIIIMHPWQMDMTEKAIDTMRRNTQVPFELVIVETCSNQCESLADIYLHFSEMSNFVKDFNAGIDASSGDIVVHTANDVFVGRNWLEAILECFEIKKDCGIASLAASTELGQQESDRIIESFSYNVLMAFERKWRLDSQYEGIRSDTDLVMCIYEDGKKMYRNLRSSYTHLIEQTRREMFTAEDLKGLDERSRKTFEEKHKDSQGTIIYEALFNGWVFPHEKGAQ